MKNYEMNMTGEEAGLNDRPMLNFCRVFGARTGRTFDVSILFFEKKIPYLIVSKLLIIDHHRLLLMKSFTSA
jgi:hypothetical protein